MDLNQRITTTLNVETDTLLYLTNMLEESDRAKTLSDEDYDVLIDYYVGSDYNYDLSFDVTVTEDVEEPTSEDLVITTITFYNSESGESLEKVLENKIYADTKTHITNTFTTPIGTTSFDINIHSENDATLENIVLKRDENLSDGEIT